MKTILKSVVAAAAFVAMGVASAADPVASVSEMSGLVTVSQGDKLGNAVKGTQLVPGSVVATSASSSAVIRYKQGCDVKLEANQSLKISDSNPCGAVVAGTEHVWAAAGLGAGILLLPWSDGSGK
jgi:hypothetical protein